MITHKNDESFFGCVVIPINLGYSNIIEWFNHHRNSRYRFINDMEADYEGLNLKDREELYPGVTSIAVVMNPWERAYRAYERSLNKMKVNEKTSVNQVVALDDFESYIVSAQNTALTKKIPNFWYGLYTPQIDWVRYYRDDKLHKAKHIMKFESINDDFRVIQDYFCNDDPLYMNHHPIEYQEFYNSKTKKIIEDIFYEDIKEFDYKF
jgi:hypothetical protein